VEGEAVDYRTTYVFEWPKFYERFCSDAVPEGGVCLYFRIDTEEVFRIDTEEVPHGCVGTYRTWFDTARGRVVYIRSWLNPDTNSYRALGELLTKCKALADLRDTMFLYGKEPPTPDLHSTVIGGPT
jgi:hypothetical protein